MKSKLPPLKEYREVLKTLSKSKLINICVDWLRREKMSEYPRNIEAANEIVENVGLPTEIGGITPKQALEQLKELGFSLKEIKEIFPKEQHPGLWEKGKEQNNESNTN